MFERDNSFWPIALETREYFLTLVILDKIPTCPFLRFFVFTPSEIIARTLNVITPRKVSLLNAIYWSYIYKTTIRNLILLCEILIFLYRKNYESHKI